MLEVVDGHAGAQSDREHVDPLVDAVPAQHLGAQQLPVRRGEEHLDEHGRAARVIRGVVVLVGVHLAVLDPSLAQLGLGQSRPAGGHIERLHDGRPLAAPIGTLVIADRLGRDAPLPVGRAGQHGQDRLPRQQVRRFHGVTGSEDVGDRGPHLGVDADAPEWPDRHPGHLRQLGVGSHADGEHDDVGDQLRAVRELDQELRAPLADRLGRTAESDVDAVGRDVEVEDPGHLRVQPRHQTVCPLDDRGVQASGAEGLCHLQADVAASDDDGPGRIGIEFLDDAIHVGNVAQDIDSRVVGPGNGWSDGLGPGAQHQLVVGLAVGSPSLDFAYLDLLCRRVDADHFVTGAHVERQRGGQALGGLQQQAVAVGNLTADVVRKAAIGEGDVAAPLEDDDLGRVVEPSHPGTGGRPRGHSPHDHNLHDGSLRFAGRQQATESKSPVTRTAACSGSGSEC